MFLPAIAGLCSRSAESLAIQIFTAPPLPLRPALSGPSHPDGLHLRSRRIPNGLEAHVTLSSKYCAFPGIINGGVVSTLMDCHGNWTAAIALMDKACLPQPPLTLTASVFVSADGPIGGGGRGDVGGDDAKLLPLTCMMHAWARMG